MLVFLNAASFDNQGTSVYQSGQLLLRMMAAVERLFGIGAEASAIYRDSELRDRAIMEGRTFKHVLVALQQQIRRDEAEQLRRQAAAKEQLDLPATVLRFSQFLSYLTQSPLANEEFDKQQFGCLYGNRDVSYEAIGYVAHFTRAVFEGTGSPAVVVSLTECPPFAATWLDVVYMQGKREEPRIVWNVTTADDVVAVARSFEHNPKHDRATVIDGVRIAEMDLRGVEAQRLLNQAVQLPAPHDRRLYARHNGWIYVFPCHENERRAYHGYPITPAELRQRMSEICSALYRHLQWEELRP